MNNDYKSPAFKKLLDSLQQQSWELELIISGFAIFGLFTAYEPIKIQMVSAENEQQIISFAVYFVALIAASILLFNLLLHVVLRGLWIGALGLRYVSGDIEFDKLKYSDRFRNYLSRKIVSFDRYIANLENYCSILFAISFLLIFYVLAFTLVVVGIALVANYILSNDELPKWLSQGVGIPLIIFLILGQFLTFIDFVSQGLLKKNKWVAKIYFPFYWVFSFLTLSFLYRPLIYNFLDNRFGKRLFLLLLPVYVAILLLTSVEYKNSNYLDKAKSSTTYYANAENYMDMLTDDGKFPGDAAIPSKVINTTSLQVFIPFSESIENRIFDKNESLKPENDVRGYGSSITFNNKMDNGFSFGQQDSLSVEYLKTFNQIYTLQIDSLKYTSDFIMTTNIKDQLGFETNINIRDLTEGKHVLKVNRKLKQKDTVIDFTFETIPFWYYKK
ncbi:MAG: hypothetical protein HKP38_05530 [Croceitalea sp.]|nr:hypothetical protein [Croceitalea sp.]NNL08666.1 hypothetical protein [Croceitalea sp.]